jgi:hypothetical protein
MASWHWADSDERFFCFLILDEPAFHCWKSKRGWDLAVNSQTPRIDYCRIYSLWAQLWEHIIHPSIRVLMVPYIYQHSRFFSLNTHKPLPTQGRFDADATSSPVTTGTHNTRVTQSWVAMSLTIAPTLQASRSDRFHSLVKNWLFEYIYSQLAG